MLLSKRIYIYIIIILASFPFIIELISKFILYLHLTFFTNNENFPIEKNSATKNNQEQFKRYDPEVAAIVDAAINKSYYYESYLIWKYGATNSKYANADADGYRLNSKNKRIKDINDKKIWFIGGTEVFGYRNSDENTLPAQLERGLNETYSEKFSVKNMGQLSYVSMQTFLSLRFELLKTEIEKPELIIILNGFDDFKNYWKVGHIYSTDFYTHDFLSKYWKLHNAEIFFDKQKLIHSIQTKYLHNTFLLIKKAKKYFVLNKYKSNINDWKTDYINTTDNYTDMLRKNINMYYSFYISNMRDIIYLCKKNDIKILMLHTPTLFTTKKKLVAFENDDFYHVGGYFFSMNKEQIKNSKNIPSHHVLRKWYWDLDYFREGYQYQKKLLKNLAYEMKVNYFDLDNIVDNTNDKPVFENFANPTDIGNRVYSDALKDEVYEILN